MWMILRAARGMRSTVRFEQPRVQVPVAADGQWPQRAHREAGVVRECLGDRAVDEHRVGMGVGGEPGGDVDDLAVDVPVPDEDGPGGQPDPQPGEYGFGAYAAEQ